ncbi:MAG: hypothetical protein DMF93_12845 [Acidobacteria bacterium]|nr:MAG: hypothetical protein DMF93_12845 [Acidobacteriota bacterium]
MKIERAAAEQHERGDADVDVAGVHRSVRQRQVEILPGDPQVVRREHFLGVEREVIQVVDAREALFVGDRPLMIAARLPRALDVEAPRRRARARSELRERVDDQLVAVAGQRPGERLAVALLNDRAVGARQQLAADEVARAVAVRRRAQLVHERDAVARAQHALQPRYQDAHGVGVLRARRGAGENERQECQGRAQLHGRPAGRTRARPHCLF